MDTNESVETPAEATQALSPQFAALAKAKRALQAKERALQAKEAALNTSKPDNTALDEYKARLKREALRVLQEEGVTYDQLTEQVLSSSQDNPSVSRLEAEIKAIKDSLENQSKSQIDREKQVRDRALAVMQRDADKLVSEGDTYEMVREAGYAKKAIELIDKTACQDWRSHPCG